jgi:hypothetical protein
VLYEGVSELLILSYIVLGTAVCELLMRLLLRQDRRSFHYAELEKNILIPTFLRAQPTNPMSRADPFPKISIPIPRNAYVTLATR